MNARLALASNIDRVRRQLEHAREQLLSARDAHALEYDIRDLGSELRLLTGLVQDWIADNDNE